ncbi:MAG: thiopurine S-methyltransferase [Pseudomonadota bacterium]
MEPEFWHRRWNQRDLGFHEPEGNALLTRWFPVLGLEKGQRVFVPLCGKTRDVAWLLSQGLRVVGCELSEVAVRELFQDLGVEPDISVADAFTVYSGPGLDVFVGDFFELSGAMLGDVDAIYDRAALVAMPGDLRVRYTERLMRITDRSPQLLITFEYDQRLMKGPPFSVNATEIASHYADRYEVELLEQVEVRGGLKGICAAREQIWHLS